MVGIEVLCRFSAVPERSICGLWDTVFVCVHLKMPLFVAPWHCFKALLHSWGAVRDTCARIRLSPSARANNCSEHGQEWKSYSS